MASGVDTKDSRWYFTPEQLQNSPSRTCGIDADQELLYRQQTAYQIQHMGQQLKVSQLCINTAIVYMHRFYAFHSFTHFNRNGMAAASLFLAAKVEEQPRKLEHIIRLSYMCLNTDPPDLQKEAYAEQAQDLVFNENVLLQTLGFDVAIDHPHTHVVKTCHLVKACKDLAQTSYFMASNSLHLTTMCLQYRPTVVACFCIHLACKWSRWEIPQSTEGKHWFHYVDKTVTMDLLKQLTDEFIHIYEKSPSRLKTKLNSIIALPQSVRIDDPLHGLMPSTAGAVGASSSSGGSSNVSSGGHHETSRSSSSHHRSHPSSTHSAHHHGKQTGDHGSSSSSSKAASASSGIFHKPPYQTGGGGSGGGGTGGGNAVPSGASASSGGQRGSMRGNSSMTDGPMSGQPPPPYSAGVGMSGSGKQQISSGNSGGTQSKSSSFPIEQNGLFSAPAPSKSRHYHGHGGMSSQTKSSSSSTSSSSSSSLSSDHRQIKSNNNSNAGNVGLLPTPSNNSTQDEQQLQKQSSNVKFNSSSTSSGGVGGAGGNKQQQPPYHSSSSSLSSVQKASESNVAAAAAAAASASSFRLTDDTSLVNALHNSSYDMSPPRIASKPSSIFSPEWKDTTMPIVSAVPPNLHTATPSGGGNQQQSKRTSTGGTALPISKPSRDSPNGKKYPFDKQRSDTPTKKEKRTNDLFNQKPTKLGPSPVEKRPKKMAVDQMSGGMEVPSSVLLKTGMATGGSIMGNQSGGAPPIKRTHAFDDLSVKEEGIDFRDTKMRKLEQISPKSVDMKPLYGNINTSLSLSSSTFANTVNGIETNPDLVSSLLKESLCSDTSKISSTLPILDMSALPPPPLHVDMPISDNAIGCDDSLMVTMLTGDDQQIANEIGGHRIKSEKKKKKDKHKHKEKEKVKDKEERKKHKKDKDRHKDRDKSVSPIEHHNNPIKITIPKDKLNLSQNNDSSTMMMMSSSSSSMLSASSSSLTIGSNSGGSSGNLTANTSQPSGFKIKIPKDRLKSDIGSSNQAIHGAGPPNSAGGQQLQQQQMKLPTSSLKIKISKDMIENFNSSSSGGGGGSNSSSHHHHHHYMNNGSSSGGGGGSSSGAGTGSASTYTSHSHTSKKKERDRDRDRSDKSSSKALKQAAAAAAAASAATAAAAAAASAAAAGNFEFKQNGGGGNTNGSSNNSNGGAINRGASATVTATVDPNKMLPPPYNNNNSLNNMAQYSFHSQQQNTQQQQQHHHHTYHSQNVMQNYAGNISKGNHYQQQQLQLQQQQQQTSKSGSANNPMLNVSSGTTTSSSASASSSSSASLASYPK